MQPRRLHDFGWNSLQTAGILMAMLKLVDLFVVYGDSQYAELAVFLDFLKALQMLHQEHHWQASGSDAYGDHLLFQRLYEGVQLEIDQLGEKTVSMGGMRLVDSRLSLENISKFMSAVIENSDVGQYDGMSRIKMSLLAERSFLSAGEKLMEMLSSKKQLSRGIENLLGAVLDAHETHVYLLDQRTKTT